MFMLFRHNILMQSSESTEESTLRAIFQQDFSQPFPFPLPAPFPLTSTFPHAPNRVPKLSHKEKLLALKNALRYFSESLHE